MVRITNYKEKESQNGEKFFVLEVHGGIEVVKSKNGSTYVTARKASIPSTFDETTCKTLLGTRMPGTVKREVCEPYNYTIKDSGEVIELSHRYVYIQTSDNPNELSESLVDSKGELLFS